jgi:hypothetical protein
MATKPSAPSKNHEGAATRAHRGWMSETPHLRMRRGKFFFLTSHFIEPAPALTFEDPVMLICA